MSAMMNLASKAAHKIEARAVTAISYTFLNSIQYVSGYSIGSSLGESQPLSKTFLISLNIILIPWRKPVRLNLLNISSTIIFR